MSEAIQSASPFDEDYFMNGIASGKSNYENYVWKRDLTVFCCARMMLHLGAQQRDTVLDYGCSRGYYCKALAMLGYHSTGYDISEWAIANCDPEVKWRVSNVLRAEYYDWVISKDTLEHIPKPVLRGTIEAIIRMARKGALIIVPLGETGYDFIGDPIRKFVAPQDNADQTHVNCFGLEEWLNLIQAVIDKGDGSGPFPVTVSGGFKLPGVKEACDPYPNSVGFITIRRL